MTTKRRQYRAAVHRVRVCAVAARTGAVVAVAPGLIEQTPFFGAPLPDERLQLRRAETVTGRVGVPNDVAQTLHWLASEQPATSQRK